MILLIAHLKYLPLFHQFSNTYQLFHNAPLDHCQGHLRWESSYDTTANAVLFLSLCVGMRALIMFFVTKARPTHINKARAIESDWKVVEFV